MSVTCDIAGSDSSTNGGAGLVNMMLTGTVLMVQAAHCSEMMVQAILHGIILHKPQNLFLIIFMWDIPIVYFSVINGSIYTVWQLYNETGVIE